MNETAIAYAPMIDGFKKVANALQFLRLPVIALGVFSAAALLGTIATSKSHEEDLFLIPSAVALLWSIATYSFLLNFSVVPPRGESSWGLWARLKRRSVRAWYWLIGMIFVATSLAVLMVSYRMIGIWLRNL